VGARKEQRKNKFAREKVNIDMGMMGRRTLYRVFSHTVENDKDPRI
jgi:hypothetical protein